MSDAQKTVQGQPRLWNYINLRPAVQPRSHHWWIDSCGSSSSSWRDSAWPRVRKDVIEIAIGEALANAVIDGNRENRDKNVEVTCRCSMDGDVLIIVRDQGTGFESRAVPDPTEPERLFLTAGRGLHLMRALRDEVSFQENGTVVRMRKRVKTSRG
jgi:anti-sigma regulatory factor (Ser/Thr protein kinase)